MPHQVLARKWRPRELSQVIGQEPILRMISNALKEQRIHHAYLFTGTRGVGKTSIGRILAKCLNCETGITATPCNQCSACLSIDAGKFLDLIEVDAASRTKVEDTRELLDNVPYPPTQGRYKIYLIDETHMLSGHSFNALLKTLEEPPKHVVFILATTDPKRLPITVLSRCLQFHLKRVPLEKIAAQLLHICTEEGITAEATALNYIANAADGSVRDALSLLDQAIAFCNNTITADATRDMLGFVEQSAIEHLLQAVIEKNGQQLLAHIQQLAEHSPNFQHVLEDLLSLLHRISIAQIIPEQASEHEKALAARVSAEDIQLFYQIALIGRRDLPLAPNPHYGFEMVMLRMLAFTPVMAADTLRDSRSATSSGRTGQEDGSVATPSGLTGQGDRVAAPPVIADEWASLLNKLGLSGMAYALAVNCTLNNKTADSITLNLSIQHQPMLNQKLTERIEQALIDHLQRPIKLHIQITKEALHTPLQQQQDTKAAQLATATERLKNDQKVQEIIGLFNATLDVNSVKPVDAM